MSLQIIFKDSKGRWRDAVLWKIVPNAWHSDRKWPIAHGRKASSTDDQYRWRCRAKSASSLRISWMTKFISVIWRRRPLNTFELIYCKFEVNPFLCFQPVKLTEEQSECYQTSTTSNLVEQLHSSLTEAAEEDVEEYRPVSCYHSPDYWGQVTSTVTMGLDTERRIERSCLSTSHWCLRSNSEYNKTPWWLQLFISISPTWNLFYWPMCNLKLLLKHIQQILHQNVLNNSSYLLCIVSDITV